jgi:WD40 repeat protein
MVISADKSIKLVNSETGDVVIDHQNAHKMGLTELSFSSDWEFFTSSSDRSIKHWKIDIEGKTISEVKTL